MNIFFVFLIAIGLSMDAFAVSVIGGLSLKELRLSHALKIASSFGIFQAIMPIVGWFAGLGVRALIAGIDHWVAFGILSVVGCKMIIEAEHIGGDKNKNILDPFTLLFLGMATSIDALAVGLSFSFLKISIFIPALIIGTVTFLVCLGGVFIGRRVGHFFEGRIERLGGLILIAIAIFILLQHSLP